MYKAIFFDLDDTILNFKSCSESALEKAFSRLKLKFGSLVFEEFSTIDRQLWIQQRQGLLTVQNVIDARFGMLLENLRIEADKEQLKDIFQNNLYYEYCLEPHAREALEYLRRKYALFAASNGIKAMQSSRLEKGSLSELFSDVYVSDEIGYEKPDLRFFDEILTRSGMKKEEVLFIGDSLEADILGAAKSGMATCWYNPHQTENKGAVKSNYTIDTLAQLVELF